MLLKGRFVYQFRDMDTLGYLVIGIALGGAVGVLALAAAGQRAQAEHERAHVMLSVSWSHQRLIWAKARSPDKGQKEPRPRYVIESASDEKLLRSASASDLSSRRRSRA